MYEVGLKKGDMDWSCRITKQEYVKITAYNRKQIILFYIDVKYAQVKKLNNVVLRIVWFVSRVTSEYFLRENQRG